MKIARQMGTFLTALHSMSIDRARQIGMNEMDPTDFWSYIEQNPAAWPSVRDRLIPRLPIREQRWVEHLYERFIAQTRATPLPLVVRHSDMQPQHIIVREETHELSGVIDFAWRIADPAGDFKAFELYSRRFVDEVHAHYALPIDPEFDERRLFYTGHDMVFETMSAIDRNDTAAIRMRMASLSAYIAGHPF